jgi:hypothetical protein
VLRRPMSRVEAIVAAMSLRRKISKRPQAARVVLWLGSPPPSMADDGFASEEAAREAWFRHRAHFMAHFAGHGKRPMGWWWFESPVPFPGYFKQRSTLYEHNLLDVAERAELLAYWRQQFERAGPAAFFRLRRAGRILRGRDCPPQALRMG